MAPVGTSVSTTHIPTLVDVDLLGPGSARMRDGNVTRSMSMKLNFMNTANAAIRDFERASAIATKADPGYDGFSTMDVAFGIIGSRLNDIAIRAMELEDGVLMEILKSIGMVRDDTVHLINMGGEDGPSVLMPGLGQCKEEVEDDERIAIAKAVRAGVHHHSKWTLAMNMELTRDTAAMEWIAESIEGGHMDSTFCPRAFVGRWKLHVAADS